MGSVRDTLRIEGMIAFTGKLTTMVYKALELMFVKSIGSLLIMEDHEIVGCLEGLANVIESVFNEQHDIVEDLEHCIAGRYSDVYSLAGHC